MSQLLKPCLNCGQLSDGPRCEQHRPVPMPKTSAHSRGYDYQWTKLSKRARQAQPFCSDCGTRDDLTADHSEEAWDRKSRGLVIRLQDVAVVCRACNSKRGAARGDEVGMRGTPTDLKTPGERHFSNYTPGGYPLGGGG